MRSTGDFSPTGAAILMNAPSLAPSPTADVLARPGRLSPDLVPAIDGGHGRSGALGRSGHRRLRLFDLVVTLAVLPFALVIGVVIAILIKIDSPGPVFYRATRVGKGGNTFRMLKFRKMLRTAKGAPLTLVAVERFTPIGQFLALTKLDEMPQLVNVLRGEMRLVGPRPEDVSFVAQYREHYDEILSVVPGITGPAAVQFASESRLLSGQADPVAYYREHLMPLKIDIDIAYTRNRSVWGDVRILVATLVVPALRLLRGTGARHRAGLHHHTVMLAAGCALLFALSALAAGV